MRERRKTTVRYTIETTSDNDAPIEYDGYKFWPKELFAPAISASNTMYIEPPEHLQFLFRVE